MWHEKTLFSLVTDNARGLLLTTLPSTSKWKDTTSLPGTTTAVPGSQLSARFAAHNFSASSYTSVSSGTQDTLLMSSVKGGKGGGRGKRKGRKKVVTTMDHLPEESKSAEYKAIEAFLKANHGTLHDMSCDRMSQPLLLCVPLHTHPHTPPSSLLPPQPPLLLMTLTSLDRRTSHPAHHHSNSTLPAGIQGR